MGCGVGGRWCACAYVSSYWSEGRNVSGSVDGWDEEGYESCVRRDFDGGQGIGWYGEGVEGKRETKIKVSEEDLENKHSTKFVHSLL